MGEKRFTDESNEMMWYVGKNGIFVGQQWQQYISAAVGLAVSDGAVIRKGKGMVYMIDSINHKWIYLLYL